MQQQQRKKISGLKVSFLATSQQQRRYQKNQCAACEQDIDLHCINPADTECHSSARNNGGCPWSHTGAFSTPTHRVISVSKPRSPLHGWSLIGSWGFWDKGEDSFVLFFDSVHSNLSHKKTKRHCSVAAWPQFPHLLRKTVAGACESSSTWRKL